MAAKKFDFSIQQGETWQRVIRWENLPYLYRAITGITKAAPAVLTVVAHGLTDGWRVAPVSVQGMTEINALNTTPRDSDYHQVTVVDVDHISLNDVNSADFTAYTSGGYVQFYTPVDLAGATGNMDVKDGIGGTVLFSLNPANSRMVFDNTKKTITLSLLDSFTEAPIQVIPWTTAVYDLDVVVGGVTTPLYLGNLKFIPE